MCPISEYRSAFDVLDADHDGKISCDDLRMFYADSSSDMDEAITTMISAADSSDMDEAITTMISAADSSSDMDEAITTMISAADSNKNGFVEYEEFELVLRRFSGENDSLIGGLGVMEDVFKVMDKDGDGRLSGEDLKSCMESAGLCWSDEDIEGMMRLAMAGGDDDKQGVSYHHLLNLFAS